MGADEDTDGGFRHGGWSMPFFDLEVMGAAIDVASKGTDALLYGPAHLTGDGRRSDPSTTAIRSPTG